MNYGGVSIIRETGELISRNPNTGEIVGTVPVASEADVMTAVSRACNTTRVGRTAVK